ncbi:MAG: hypothetical protein M3N16_02640 [Actinomycetota bacterium]|nr:hypothetical protein [Actinomycetota bacterium]
MSVRHEAKLDALGRELRCQGRTRALVFVRTKRGADRLVNRLGAHDLTALAMHGDKSQSQRERRSRGSSAGASTRSSPPRSRRAASTSRASPT